MLKLAAIAIAATIAALSLIDWGTSSFFVRPCLIEKVVQPSGHQNPNEQAQQHTCAYQGGLVVEGISYAAHWHAEVWTALGTLVIAAFTTILGLFTVSLARSTRIAASAAKEAADVAERALVAVERPILIISINDKYEIGAGRPKFSIAIENVGRQVAHVNVATAALIIQIDGNFPVNQPSGRDGTTCTTIPVVGQRVIRPGHPINIACQRQKPITVDESGGVKGGTMYAFFLVGLIYVDPLGNDRVSRWVGLLRPSGRFVQVFGGDAAGPQLRQPKEHEQTQQALVDTILGIERKRGYPFQDE